LMCNYLYDDELKEWRQPQKVKKDQREREKKPIPVEVTARQ